MRSPRSQNKRDPWGSPAPSELCPRCLLQGQGEEGRERRGGESQQPFHLGGHAGHGPQRQVRACRHRLPEEICWLGKQVSPHSIRRLQIRWDGELLLPSCDKNPSHCGLHVMPLVHVTRASLADGWILSLGKGELYSPRASSTVQHRHGALVRAVRCRGDLSTDGPAMPRAPAPSVWASLILWPVSRALRHRPCVSLSTQVGSPLAT